MPPSDSVLNFSFVRRRKLAQLISPSRDPTDDVVAAPMGDLAAKNEKEEERGDQLQNRRGRPSFSPPAHDPYYGTALHASTPGRTHTDSPRMAPSTGSVSSSSGPATAGSGVERYSFSFPRHDGVEGGTPGNNSFRARQTTPGRMTANRGASAGAGYGVHVDVIAGSGGGPAPLTFVPDRPSVTRRRAATLLSPMPVFEVGGAEFFAPPEPARETVSMDSVVATQRRLEDQLRRLQDQWQQNLSS